MRITLTLDEDVAEKLRMVARESGRSFREVVNESIRQGLAGRRAAQSTEPYRVNARDLGNLRPGLGLDGISELLERAEGPLHR